MKYGLYEKVLDRKLIEEVNDKKHTKIRNIDNSEVDRVLSIEYQKRIRETLLQINNNVEKMKFIDKLNNIIEIDGFEYEDEKFKELLSIHDNKDDFDILNEYRPKTSMLREVSISI